jgi:hypothetical protein
LVKDGMRVNSCLPFIQKDKKLSSPLRVQIKSSKTANILSNEAKGHVNSPRQGPCRDTQYTTH